MSSVIFLIPLTKSSFSFSTIIVLWKRLWEEEREGLLFAYNQDSFTGSSSALLVYELAWRLSRDTNDLLWWAIVGHTELWINKKMDEDRDGLVTVEELTTWIDFIHKDHIRRDVEREWRIRNPDMVSPLPWNM